MKYLKIYFIFASFLIYFIISSTVVEEKKLFEINTLKNTYVHYNLEENKNNCTFLFVQVILCHDYSGSHLKIENTNGKQIFSTDILNSMNFYVDIADDINNDLIINATSTDMYVQYQYIFEEKDIINSSANIKNYSFDENYISFEMIPVVNNTETTYDLYYLGKINIYNDICQKVVFILNNEPISTVDYLGIDNFDLKFENIQFKTGYYLIKGNNVNDISFYYFYERINVVNRLGPFETNQTKFFEVKSESDEFYSVFNTNGNPDKKKIFKFTNNFMRSFNRPKISYFNI